jgi:DNA ligase-1
MGLEHLYRPLDDLGISWLDGELYSPGQHFQVTSGQIRNHGNAGNISYYIFDVGVTEPFNKRVEIMDKLRPLSGFVKVLPHILIYNEDELLEYFEKALEGGFEGLVIKTVGHQYQLKRSSDWLKLKAVQSADIPCLEVFEGEGKYQGMLGGLLCDYEGAIVRVGSGFSDADRMHYWENPDKIIGKTIEVEYHEVTPDGSLRHPRFKGIRIDK